MHRGDNIADDVMPIVEAQTLVMLEQIDALPTMMLPRTIIDGEVDYIDLPNWTAGFFPGVLWYIHALSPDNSEMWAREAERFSNFIERGQYHTHNHDIGFIMMSSYGNGYRFYDHKEYVPVVIQSAKTLTKRYRPIVGAIQSWGEVRDVSQIKDPNDKRQCVVIVDNMMNLELLFEATALSGDSTYYNMAVSHADVTMRDHFRDDDSSYQIVNYSLESGKPLHKYTGQGLHDESAWAQGQAWGLYGYTMSYRYTQNPAYLDMAERIARFMIEESNQIEDGVLYWDFDAEKDEIAPRDASAAAIMASALYELYTYVEVEEYRRVADRILTSLSSPEYLAEVGTNGGFLLKHSTGNYPTNYAADEPLNFADYYYLESLYRQKQLNSGVRIGYVAHREL